MLPRRRQKLEQVCSETGIECSLVIEFIHQTWIVPASKVDSTDHWELDEEDIARIRLILELRRDFGVNDEAIPIILHLLDQIYAIRARLGKLSA